MKKHPIRLILMGLVAATAVQADPNTTGSPGFSAPLNYGSDLPTDLPIRDSDAVIARFRKTNADLQNPRFLIYVNRALVTDRGELVETTRTEKSVKTKGDPVAPEPSGSVQIGVGNQSGSTGTVPQGSGKGGERLVTESSYARTGSGGSLGVSPLDEFEARKVEELFQKPFLAAGARLIDQKTARLAMKSFTAADPAMLTAAKTDVEREEVEALRKTTDIVIEILARNTRVSIPEVSGNDRVVDRLEATAVAIRLSDGTKLAQVSSDSLFGFNTRDGDKIERRSRRVTSAEVIEQVALAVMEQMGR
jgi:hypothetical protein